MGGKIRQVHKSGFSVVEVIVAITIIGILASIITITFDNVRKSTRTSEREADIEVIASALEKYYSRHGEYPPPSKLAVASGGAYVVVSVLPGIEPSSLVAPKAPSGTTNSITLLSDYSYENMTEDIYGYSVEFSANPAQCEIDEASCTNYILFYKDEVNQVLKSRCSQYGKTTSMPCN